MKMSMLAICLALPSALTHAETIQPIRVLIVDGFSNQDWAHTTALIREVLEPTKLFTVSVATCPAKTDDPVFATFRPRFSDFDVVLLNCNSLGNGGQWPAEVRESFVTFHSRL